MISLYFKESAMASKPSVLITGASTGIGAVYADRLARRGRDLVLVARDRVRMEALADRLSRRPCSGIRADGLWGEQGPCSLPLPGTPFGTRSQGGYVQAVLPSATRTEIWERSGRDVNALPAVMEVEDLVDAA